MRRHPFGGRRQIENALDATRAVHVRVAPYRAELPERDRLARFVFFLKFVAVARLTEGIDRRAVVVRLAFLAPRFGRKEARTFLDFGRTGRRISVRLLATTPLPEAAADIFAAAPLLHAHARVAQFKCRTVAGNLTPFDAFTRRHVAVGAQ